MRRALRRERPPHLGRARGPRPRAALHVQARLHGVPRRSHPRPLARRPPGRAGTRSAAGEPGRHGGDQPRRAHLRRVRDRPEDDQRPDAGGSRAHRRAPARRGDHPHGLQARATHLPVGSRGRGRVRAVALRRAARPAAGDFGDRAGRPAPPRQGPPACARAGPPARNLGAPIERPARLRSSARRRPRPPRRPTGAQRGRAGPPGLEASGEHQAVRGDEDPDAAHARVKAAGGEISMELVDQDYGNREFAVNDPRAIGGPSEPTSRASGRAASSAPMTPPARPSMRPQPMISVADVEASSRWYQQVLGATSGHGGPEYERLLVDGILIMQLHKLELA
ncbi:MAG: VOC family protein, partial [Thermoleophilaceae bacterium]